MRDIEMDLASSSRGGTGASHKFLVIGDSECGKTTLMNLYCNERTKKKIKKTIGCDLHIKDFVRKRAGLDVHQYFEFWDLSGDSKFFPHLDVYMQAIQSSIQTFKGILFFFDVTNRKTLLRISKHLEMLTVKDPSSEEELDEIHNANSRIHITLPLLIIGNKSDMLETHKGEKVRAIRQYLEQEFNNDPKVEFILTSTKDGISQFPDIDKFVEDCVSGNFSELFLFNTSKGFYSQRMQRDNANKTFSGEVMWLFGAVKRTYKWIRRSIRSWIRKRNRNRELLP